MLKYETNHQHKSREVGFESLIDEIKKLPSD
jgi:hypothetical protein